MLLWTSWQGSGKASSSDSRDPLTNLTAAQTRATQVSISFRPPVRIKLIIYASFCVVHAKLIANRAAHACAKFAATSAYEIWANTLPSFLCQILNEAAVHRKKIKLIIYAKHLICRYSLLTMVTLDSFKTLLIYIYWILYAQALSTVIVNTLQIHKTAKLTL
jgi:hypothetical protein